MFHRICCTYHKPILQKLNSNSWKKKIIVFVFFCSALLFLLLILLLFIFSFEFNIRITAHQVHIVDKLAMFMLIDISKWNCHSLPVGFKHEFHNKIEFHTKSNICSVFWCHNQFSFWLSSCSHFFFFGAHKFNDTDASVSLQFFQRTKNFYIFLNHIKLSVQYLPTTSDLIYECSVERTV